MNRDTWNAAVIELECARCMFDYSLSADQIDVSIRALQNAENKLQILRDISKINGPEKKIIVPKKKCNIFQATYSKIVYYVKRWVLIRE